MNHTTRIIVATVGAFLGIAGLDHGIFGILQGNTPTSGLIIQAIGPEQHLWGTEEAFTIVPNFLMTGILAVIVSLAIIVWSIGFVHRKHGASVLGLLLSRCFWWAAELRRKSCSLPSPGRRRRASTGR